MVGVSKHLNTTTHNSQTIEVTIVNGKIMILLENDHSLLRLEIPGLPAIATRRSCEARLTLRVLKDGQLSITGLSRVKPLPPVDCTVRLPGSPPRKSVSLATPLAPRKEKHNGD